MTSNSDCHMDVQLFQQDGVQQQRVRLRDTSYHQAIKSKFELQP